MSQTARTVLPTDLVALASYDGRAYANEAITLDRIGTQASPHPLEAALEQWLSFATGRHTWISVKGLTLRGLVSARKRSSKLAWEVECLINASRDDNGVLMSLFDQMSSAAAKSGALQIFVRLPSGSETEQTVSRSGFMPYVHEVLYRRPVDTTEAHATPDGLRRAGKADIYPIFQLYNSVVPHEIRRQEAMTFSEWCGSQESLGRTSQYALERDGKLRGWLRVAGDGDIGRFHVLAGDDDVEGLIEGALAKVANRETACVLVPEYQEGLRFQLEQCGFEPEHEYTVLARRTVRVVKAAQLVPAQVEPTLG